MVLERIVADNVAGLEARKRAIPIDELIDVIRRQPLPLDFAACLRGEKIRLIAEVKKASPSRGVIKSDFDPVGIALTYAANGASAISVLTEAKSFQGSINHLRKIRATPGIRGKVPLLRKDFIYEPYQVYESRAYGADALLLIVAMLSQEKLKELLNLSRDLDMNCLVEVHDEAEVGTALKSGAGIIGINNRDLKTFFVDLTTTRRLRSLIPRDKIVVSESGIKSRSDVEKVREWGVDAMLIGEALISAPDIAARMRELL